MDWRQYRTVRNKCTAMINTDKKEYYNNETVNNVDKYYIMQMILAV